MIIFWSGLGFLVPIIGIGCLLASELLTEAAFKDDQYYQLHGWPKFVAILVAGAVVWFLGRYLNTRGAKRLIDPETNKEIWMKNSHTFFFIPMEYWGPAFLVLGIILLFVKG